MAARSPRATGRVPTTACWARLAAGGGATPGLNTTYDALLRQAFKPEWWDASRIVRVAADGNPMVADRPNRPLRAIAH